MDSHDWREWKMGNRYRDRLYLSVLRIRNRNRIRIRNKISDPDSNPDPKQDPKPDPKQISKNESYFQAKKR
jgi:hypothetical protein